MPEVERLLAEARASPRAVPREDRAVHRARRQRGVRARRRGAGVVDVSARVPSWSALVADPVAARPGDPHHPVRDVAWAPPVEEGAKVLCVGFNFSEPTPRRSRPHREVPAYPTLFTRFPDSFVGSGGAVVLGRPNPKSSTGRAKVALVVGTAGRRIAEAEALDHVAGWTCMAENSVRDWQLHTGQAVAGKNWEASGVLGPWVVTADEVGAKTAPGPSPPDSTATSSSTTRPTTP